MRKYVTNQLARITLKCNDPKSQENTMDMVFNEYSMVIKEI